MDICDARFSTSKRIMGLMTQPIKEFFTEREWEIILDAVEQEGMLEDEDYGDECGIIIDKIHSMMEN
jgi:hypothetical protein